jgi:D-sedoheptulose 7-phosphate isomerase
MNKIERLFKQSSDFREFSIAYFEHLYDLLKQLDTNAIVQLVHELENARFDQNTIFFAGNGGSAVTASHIANDIGVDVLKKGGSDKPFRVLSLTDNTAVMTAIANDSGYENLFVNQLEIHYRDGDMLVVISASGNSPNVIAAVKWVRAHGGRTVGMVGFDGGVLKDICDVVIHVKTEKGEYGPVEDIHMIIDHLISNWLICKLQRKTNP